MCLVPEARGVSDAPELDLQMVEPPDGAGNQTRAHWKSSPCLAAEPSLQPLLSLLGCAAVALSAQRSGTMSAQAGDGLLEQDG